MKSDKKASLGISKEGNTEPPSQTHRKKFYCFTLPNYETIYENVIEYLKTISEKGIVGKEICPTTKTPHLQGFIALKKAMRITELKIPGKPHLESCNGNAEQNEEYCKKEGNYFTWGYPKPIKIIENLYPWQKNIEKLYFTEPDDRKVHWFWEETGNIGKSAFVKYMIVKHKILFCSGGKHTDIMNLVFNQDMDNCRCVIFDIPRANKGHISYSSLESIKNGMVCNTKYETGVKIFNSPHLIVFANFPPDNTEELSNDRWNIVELKIGDFEHESV